MFLNKPDGAAVYAHYQIGETEPFYIGCTQKLAIRPYTKHGRSNRWKEKAAKGFIVVIVKDNLTMWDALRLEAELIVKHINTVVNGTRGELAHADRAESYFKLTK